MDNKYGLVQLFCIRKKPEARENKVKRFGWF